MRRNIYAYTAPGSSYPPYISINEEDNGNIAVTVRAVDGNSATIEMTRVQFQDLHKHINGDFASKCKRRRLKEPTPCLCCPGECEG